MKTFLLLFAAIPCWKTVRDIGKYQRVCIPAAKIDSMTRLVPLWTRDSLGRYVYRAFRDPATGKIDTVHLYRHQPRTGPAYLSHLK